MFIMSRLIECDHTPAVNANRNGNGNKSVCDRCVIRVLLTNVIYSFHMLSIIFYYSTGKVKH